MPDCGATYLLPRMIGLSRAMELSLLAEKLPAETALGNREHARLLLQHAIKLNPALLAFHGEEARKLMKDLGVER